MNVFIRVIIIFILVIIVPFTSLAGRVTVDIESPIIPVLIKKEIKREYYKNEMSCSISGWRIRRHLNSLRRL